MFRADGLKIYPTLVIRGTGKKVEFTDSKHIPELNGRYLV